MTMTMVDGRWTVDDRPCSGPFILDDRGQPEPIRPIKSQSGQPIVIRLPAASHRSHPLSLSTGRPRITSATFSVSLTGVGSALFRRGRGARGAREPRRGDVYEVTPLNRFSRPYTGRSRVPPCQRASLSVSLT